ncbi:MMPL family transporter [Streptomyces sp. NPDC050538]|uniref:MMPL family transporter n=1 Tax=Streptomyces sp. NPDC050538 TaxID=3365627 RepID=UPI0037A330BF
MTGRENLAARLGGWSARHRAIAIVGWLVVVAAAMLIGSAVGQQHMTDQEYAAGESARAWQVLEQKGLIPPADEMVLVHSDTEVAGAAGFRATVRELVSGVRATGEVTDLRDPYTTVGLVSSDRHSALVEFSMTGKANTAYQRVQPVLDAVDKVRAAHPGTRVEQFGEASANKWFNDTILKDFHRAELTAVPLALGILLAAFGALLAAVLPVGLAITAFLAANGLLALISHSMHVDSSASSVVLLLGLAVGVDYCLFYLRREREERGKGRDPQASLRIAAATSGRSVLVSGLTVVVAMSGMFLSGMQLFDGFAVGTILVVLIAMLGSVTVLPALLSLLGDRVEWGRVPGLGRLRRPESGSRIWGAILRPVLAHPGISAAASGGVLLLLAVPVLGIHTEKLSLDKQLPSNTALIQTYRHISAAFPGGASPANVVVEADDVQAPQVRRALTDFTAAALDTNLVNQPVQVTTHPKQNVVEISVPLAGNGSDSTSRRAVQVLRDDVIPQTLGKVSGVRAYVTGDTAFSMDFNAQLRRSIVPVFVFVMAVAFLVMLLSFRSLTIAAVSILLNLLSVAAAFGVMVAVFQHGWGATLVGTHAVGAIESWLPLFAFVILFGLSMDYHVFVVSRIREAHDAGASTQEAVARGIRSTAGVVTSAAIIMVAVFGVLATLSMQDFKQMGVGLGVAILLDATIVRGVLLPSVLSLLGERTWYLPSWLPLPSRHAEPAPTDIPPLAGPGSPQPDEVQEPVHPAGGTESSPGAATGRRRERDHGR